jgi:hypothetical protein
VNEKEKIIVEKILFIAENNPCGVYDLEEFDESDESPDDSIAHDFTLINKLCKDLLDIES